MNTNLGKTLFIVCAATMGVIVLFAAMELIGVVDFSSILTTMSMPAQIAILLCAGYVFYGAVWMAHNPVKFSVMTGVDQFRTHLRRMALWIMDRNPSRWYRVFLLGFLTFTFVALTAAFVLQTPIPLWLVPSIVILSWFNLASKKN